MNHQLIWHDEDCYFKNELNNLISKQFQGIIVELGVGSGHVLCHLALTHPDLFFLGIDLFSKPLVKTGRKALALNLRNIRLIRYNAIHPAILFPNNFLDGIIVNFPDPWPKRKHAKNRIFFGPIASHFHQVLKLKGWVFMQTDYRPYYQDAKALMGAGGCFEVKEQCYPSIMDVNIKSAFNRIFEAQGRPIHRFLALSSGPISNRV